MEGLFERKRRGSTRAYYGIAPTAWHSCQFTRKYSIEQGSRSDTTIDLGRKSPKGVDYPSREREVVFQAEIDGICVPIGRIDKQSTIDSTVGTPPTSMRKEASQHARLDSSMQIGLIRWNAKYKLNEFAWRNHASQLDVVSRQSYIHAIRRHCCKR